MISEQMRKYNEQHVSDSFNIYQATLQMISIMFAFVFAALLALLTNSQLTGQALGPLVPCRRTALLDWIIGGPRIWLMHPLMLVITFLVLAVMSLLTAMIAFHVTTIYVYSKWHIFFPNHWSRSLGSAFMTVGIIATAASIVTVLFWRDLAGLSGFCFLFLFAWVPLFISMRRVKTLTDSTGEVKGAGEYPGDSISSDQFRPSREEVKLTAYSLWENAGRPNGQDINFWLNAERILTQGHVPADVALGRGALPEI